MDLKTWLKTQPEIKTAQRAAIMAGVHYQTIGNLVRGEGKPVRLSTLHKIAGAMRLDVQALVGMCKNVNCRGLRIAEENAKPIDPVATLATEQAETSSPTAAEIVETIPAVAPVQTSSPIQAILSRANQLENDPE